MTWPRRMLRVVKGTLLILCLAVILLWVRSYWRMDQVAQKIASKGAVTSTAETRWVWARRGWVCASRWRLWDDKALTEREWREKLEANEWSPGWKARSHEPGSNPPTYSVQDS